MSAQGICCAPVAWRGTMDAYAAKPECQSSVWMEVAMNEELYTVGREKHCPLALLRLSAAPHLRGGV